MNEQGNGMSAEGIGQGAGGMAQEGAGQGQAAGQGMHAGGQSGAAGQGTHQVPPMPPGMAYWPGYGYFPVPPQPMAFPPPGAMPGQGAAHGQGHQGAGMAQVMQEIANGGSGLSSLTRMLDLDDKDFWKGALVGAAAVLLLTNESVQKALFRGAVKGRDAVEEGVEKVKEKVRPSKEKGDE